MLSVICLYVKYLKLFMQPGLGWNVFNLVWLILSFVCLLALTIHLCEGCEITLFIVKNNQVKGKTRGNWDWN